MNVFVDTSFFVARIMPRDQWHAQAVRAARPGMAFVTSSLVVNETISLMQARGFFSAAVAFLGETRLNQKLQIVYPDVTLQSDAWDLFSRCGGSGASAIDCVSFAIMRQMSIRKAFTFDQHFRIAGFEILR